MKNSEVLEMILQRQETVLAALGNMERKLEDIAALVRQERAAKAQQEKY